MAQRTLPNARWFTIRRAQNRKPATYRCPLCGRYLPSLSEHMLIVPEGDSQRRRHAHNECVLAARRAGRLPTRDEWLKTQPRPPSLPRRAAAFAKRLINRPEEGARDPAGERAPDPAGDRPRDLAADHARDPADTRATARAGEPTAD